MKGGGTEAMALDLATLFRAGAVGGLSDGELLGRFVERREADAFAALVSRHGPMVWGVCRRVLRDGHDAEDAFQATFLVLARRAASVRPRERLGNWLYGVAYQTARKARAMRDKRRAREAQAPDSPEPTAVADDPRDAPSEDLDRELARLPERYRVPIVLCELDGKSHAEAAGQLGWPVGTVSSRLSRGRSLLAKRLSRSGVALPAGSLGVVMAQGEASAGMPAWSVGPTAQAASRIAAGAAVSAGMVSAEVAALTEGVLTVMILNKFKAVTAAALAAALLGFASIGPLYRARAAAGPPQAEGGAKAARRPAGGAPGWRVRVEKAGRSRVTLDVNGARAAFLADAVSVDADGSTAIRGSLSAMSRESSERVEEFARLSTSRGVTARVEIEVDADGCKASYVSEVVLRVEVRQRDGLVLVAGR